MSFRAFLFKTALRLVMPRTMDIHEKRLRSEKLARKYKIPKGVLFEAADLAGVKSEWATKSDTSQNKVIIYLHGGGYCYNSINSYKAFSGGIALASGIPVLSVEYRLAPENPYPAALDDVLAVYRELLAKGYDAKSIALMGDSAGGGLCLATAMVLRDHDEPLPAALALISPWTDLAMASESHIRMAKKDPMLNLELEHLCAAAYSNGKDLKDPYISPCYGIFKGLPPMILHCGALEICADDYKKIYEKALADGVDVTYKMWKGMFHDFTVFCENTPEGMKSFLEIISWIKKNMAP